MMEIKLGNALVILFSLLIIEGLFAKNTSVITLIIPIIMLAFVEAFKR